MYYQYTKSVVIGNTLSFKNPAPLRGHLKCSWAGKIVTQLPDGPNLCVMWQGPDIVVVSHANLITVNSD
jgi:hypothetical protein